MRTDTQALRDLRNRIAPLGDLSHRVPFEIITEIDFAHHGLLASKLGKKASTNLGAIQSKFAFVRLEERANTKTSTAFLDALVEAVPYQIHTVLTDNGIQFADLPKNRNGPTARFRGHPFDRACCRHGIEHRLTRPNHPWTNGQVERMNRTIKEATVRRYHYGSHEQLRSHLDDFIAAYNFARRLKTLRGLTPFEFIAKQWTEEPNRFRLDPTHHMLGPYT